MSHARHALDPVVHLPIRFSIMPALNAVERAEFGFIRDTVEISDSLLSQHVTTLQQAGYADVSKHQTGRHTRTWLSLTPEGRAAFRRHLAILNQIAGSADGSSPAPAESGGT
jgi:DNA-binding MarR family transcriptional regulator